MIYYKGSIVNIDRIYNYFKIGNNLNSYGTVNNEDYKRRFLYSKVSFDIGFLNKMLQEFRALNDKDMVLVDENIFNAFKRLNYRFDYDPQSYISESLLNVIFSIVRDKDGYEYAKELKTGLLFPLFNKNNYNYSYNLTKYIDASLDETTYYTYSLVISPVLQNPSIASGQKVILLDRVASKNDIDDYEKKPNKSNIKYFADCNVFKDNIELAEEKSKVNEEFILLGEIEYLLSRLKITNKEEYLKFYDKYNFIIKNYNNRNLNIPITVSDLRRIRDDIKFLILFNVNKDKGYLELFETCKNNILDESSDDKPFSKIYEIDYLFEIFNNNMSYYTLLKQNDIVKNIAYLYVLIIKNNDLDDTEIINSHFEDLKYYIASLVDYNSDNLDEIDSIDLINKIKKNNSLILGK